MSNKGNYVHLVGRIKDVHNVDTKCFRISVFSTGLLVPVYTLRNDIDKYIGAMIDYVGYFDRGSKAFCIAESSSTIVDLDADPAWFEKNKDSIYEQYEILYPTKITSEFIPDIDDPDGYIRAAETVLLSQSLGSNN